MEQKRNEHSIEKRWQAAKVAIGVEVSVKNRDGCEGREKNSNLGALGQWTGFGVSMITDLKGKILTP